jgi:Fe-S oxidoreductase
MLTNFERVWAADAGCALALVRRYPEAGVPVPPPVETLAEAAARQLSRCARVPGAGDAEPVRWHDPCQLGRGLGVYEAPRALLTRALGRAPDELEERRELSVCSGAGGLLPATMPHVAEAIAAERVRAHERAGGGRIVTACASSLLALRRRSTGAAVDDLATWIVRALRPAIPSSSP